MHGQITLINSQQQELITVQVQLCSRVHGHTHTQVRLHTVKGTRSVIVAGCSD